MRNHGPRLVRNCPEPLFDSVRSRLRIFLYKARFLGLARYCPVCESRLRRFLPAGVIERSDARCPVCSSRERHRLVWAFFREGTPLFDGSPKRMLHIAPEACLEPKFRRIPGLNYLTADLLDPGAMVMMDITDIQYPDNSFDVIYCSHVLEHVPDDRKAMRELHRVLAPDGWAVLQVPITAGRTFEDPSVVDPAERERLFGQHDHVRVYGTDYKERLKEAGFRVLCFSAADVVGRENVRRMGICESEEIYFCQKLEGSMETQ
jgi:SAM-dependent methyltransferase